MRRWRWWSGACLKPINYVLRHKHVGRSGRCCGRSCILSALAVGFWSNKTCICCLHMQKLPNLSLALQVVELSVLSLGTRMVISINDRRGIVGGLVKPKICVLQNELWNSSTHTPGYRSQLWGGMLLHKWDTHLTPIQTLPTVKAIGAVW
jgi:hypothetical protein